MKQILYVEDSTMAQMLMQKYVQGMCDLTIVSLPRAAGPVLKERRFDLVITDFMFPQGDALGLIDTLRQSYSPTELPIIVVSSCMDEILLDRVLKRGANDGVVKPIKVAEFRALVERMLANPFVRVSDRPTVGVCCLEWQTGGRAYQYCPDLNLTVTGDTRDQAAEIMSARLEAAMAAGTELGQVWREAVVTHIVRGRGLPPAP
jgi:CheY-like chemotaxis protein